MAERLLEGAPEGTKVDWNSDAVFVIRYQALSYAQGQMTGEAFANAEKWLEENEDRYLNLINKKS